MAAVTFAPIIAAQSTGGRIRGTVSDPSGAAVMGAKVTLINEATNVSRDVDTGTNGDYLLIEVPVGSYEIDVAQQGFKKYVRKGVALDLNEVISVDITLQLGTTAETVEVTGAPPVVDTTTTQLGAVVNERASTQLPLNQRDVYQLLQLQPGVQSQLGNDLFYGSDRAGVVTVNGGRGSLQQLFRERRRRQRSFRQLARDRAFARFASRNFASSAIHSTPNMAATPARS